MTNCIVHDINCPRCSYNGMKQMPETWENDKIEFYEDWWFCPNCSFHFKIWPEEEKKVA